MIASRNCRYRVAVALAGMGAVLILGCGDPTGIEKRYPVSGTVTYKGKPIEKGRINFVPTAAEGRAAGGDIEDGEYELTTAEPGDGAIPGSYKVTVLAIERDDSKLKEIAKGGQYHHDAAFAKAVRSAKKLVPAKYQSVESSGLTAEVKAQTNSGVNFELTD
jgi:hypothetical protein